MCDHEAAARWWEGGRKGRLGFDSGRLDNTLSSCRTLFLKDVIKDSRQTVYIIYSQIIIFRRFIIEFFLVERRLH